MTGPILDAKFTIRTLLRSRVFTAVAILSLALGIGANTAIFTLLDQVMLRLLPVADPEQLVMIWSTGPHLGSNRGSRAASYPMYQEFQQKAEAFNYVFCRYATPLAVTIGEHTERVEAELVSGNYFQALGVRPALGRLFTPEEDDRAYKGHPVAVLSYHYWVNRFEADPSVVGRKILVNSYPMVIVGVSAPGFGGIDPASAPHLRVPIQMKPLLTPGWDGLGNRRNQWIHIFARMKPGYTVETAQASLQPLFHQILREELERPALRNVSPYTRDLFLKRQVQMQPAATGYSQLRESYSTALVVLMCMVGLVLLIACFNVANLLIARAAARQKEIAVRLAVGASRAQLMRQLLTESVFLSLIGGLLGIALSFLTIRVLLRMLPLDPTTMLLRAEPDLRILAFNFSLAVVTGLAFGLAPALQCTRPDLWSTLKDVVGAISGTGGSVSLRKALVVAQVAVSFVLLAGAALFLQSLGNLKNTNTGFRQIERLITFQVDPALNGYELQRLRAFHRRLLADVRSLPGVVSACFAGVPLLRGWEWDSTMSVEGHQATDGEDMQAFMNAISPGYWQTMGIPILEGRDFDERDVGERATVAIVNRKFAQHFFGNRSPIGRRLGFGGGPDVKLAIEIVGMVEDSLYEGPRQGVRRQVFIPNAQMPFPASVSYYVRTALDPEVLYSALRESVRSIDPSVLVYEMKTLGIQLDETLSTERLTAALSTAFGALATLLAAIGLYGVMAFVVGRRTREIGLRMAIGAKQSEVVWLVMREVLLLLSMGLVIGVPSAYALSRYISTQLFGVGALDPQAWLLALSILVVAVFVAGYFPARRASTIDPLNALRYE